MMQTLSYLNGVGSSLVTYTENRPSGVIFDRPLGKNYNFTEVTLSFPLLIGANIVEIINPAVANVRYKINLGSALASLSYSGLPGGVTVSQSGTIFTYFGIDSLVDWEAIKQPTIVLDPAFQGSFSYDATIVYNTDTSADNEFEWNVGVYVPVAQLLGSCSIILTPKYIKGTSSNMISVSTFFVEGTDVLPNQFTMVTTAEKITDFNKNLPAQGTFFAKPRQFTFNDSTITINNPDPYQDGRFGQFFGVNNDYVITSAQTSTPPTYNYSTFVFDINNGDLLQTINGYLSSPVVSSESFFINRTSELNGDGTFNLYKKVSGATPYTLLDTVTLPYDPFTDAWFFPLPGNCITDNYVVLKDVTAGGSSSPSNRNNYAINVYSIDPSTGLSLLYSKQGAGQMYFGTLRSQRFAEQVAVSDSYLCVSEDIQVAGQPNTRKIFVYATNSGSLLRTINNSDEIYDLKIDGDILYALTSYGFLSWNLTTGNTNFIYPGIIGRRLNRYAENFWGINDRINQYESIYIYLYNELNGNLESTITQQNDDFRYVGNNTLVILNFNYIGTFTSEGIILIKRET